MIGGSPLLDEVSGLPGLAFAFALVLCRVGATVMLLPGLGEVELPPTVRAGLTFALTALLVPAVAPLVPSATDGWGAGGMIAAELLTGGVLGWLARLPALALSMAGAVVSYMTGLSSVVQTDPALGGQSAALARLFGILAPTLILSTGLYALPLSALAGSYHVVPPGAVMPAGSVMDLVQTAVGASFGLAIRLSAPFLLAGVLFHAALGVLARMAPQLQIISAASPGQILGGLLLLGLLAAPMVAAWSGSVQDAWSALPGL